MNKQKNGLVRRPALLIASLLTVSTYSTAAFAQTTELQDEPYSEVDNYSVSEPQPAFSATTEEVLAPFYWQAANPDAASAGQALRQRLLQALDRQPRLQAQWAQEQESRLRIDEVRAERLPQVSMGLEQRNSLQEVNRNAFDSGNRLDAYVSVSQLLYDFGASGERVDSAELSARAQVWESRVSAEELVLDALTAHFDVVRYQAQFAIAQDNLEQHQQILEDVSARRQGGAGSSADVLRAESRLAEASAQQTSLQGQLAQAQNRYQELFFQVPTGLALPMFELPEVPVIEAALDDAITANAELQRSLFDTDAAQAEARATQASQLPRLSAIVEGRQFNVDEPSESESDLALRFQVDYQPYTGGAASSRSAQAEQRAERAYQEREALRRDLEARLRTAFTDVKAQRELWKAQSLNLEANVETLSAYRAQFGIGRRDLNDVLDAQRELFQSATALVDSRTNWELARYRQLLLTGELLPALDIDVLPEFRNQDNE
ncbi:TolC family protein [Halomonas sp. CH40]